MNMCNITHVALCKLEKKVKVIQLICRNFYLSPFRPCFTAPIGQEINVRNARALKVDLYIFHLKLMLGKKK